MSVTPTQSSPFGTSVPTPFTTSQPTITPSLQPLLIRDDIILFVAIGLVAFVLVAFTLATIIAILAKTGRRKSKKGKTELVGSGAYARPLLDTPSVTVSTESGT